MTQPHPRITRQRVLTLSKKITFEASHQLIHHDGKCAKLHGHSWVVRITVLDREGKIHQSGPKQNMLMDYADMKSPLKRIVDLLDHSHLNEVLNVEMPTSEYLALWIYDQLKPEIPSLWTVEVDETCTSSCKVIENDAVTTERLQEA